jgi:hypothetical protein
VSSVSINHLLKRLDEAKKNFSRRGRLAFERLFVQLKRGHINDAEALLSYHETLLFLAAYPSNNQMLRLVNRELSQFAGRITKLQASGEDLSPLEHPESSGIAGLPVTDTFSYHIVRWLLDQAPARVALDWDWFEDENRLGETWPRFMPLLEEDTLVEANIPFRQWLRAAAGPGRRQLAWLIQQFAQLKLKEKEKAELYNSLQLYVTWTPAYRESRTGMRLKTRKVFYHRDPLIQRRDVSLKGELESRPTELQLLSAKQGEELLDLARVASTVRYRELYGFTHGDPRKVFQASLGRGVEVFIIGVPPGVRLLLRAYHAAMIFKNGVAVGYFEGLSLFERMESGFNLYYTFRDGETAWLYARLLNIFRHLLGVTAFSIDPYQIGFENEEGIESGAFWFYRKLGFRPTRPDIMKLMLNEERKIATRKDYRTPARTLRKLAVGPMIFELEQANSGDWDRFQLRNIGLAIQRRMAAKYQGVAENFRLAAVEKLTRALGLLPEAFAPAESPALNDFAVALSLVDLSGWNAAEKRALTQVVRAKAKSDESRYLKLMQRHARLRNAMIKLGT